MSELHDSTVTDDGVRLAYKLVGDGPHPLLLMPGWGGAANSWDSFTQSLDPRRFRTVAYDIRGHGESDKVSTGFTDERFARDALAVADAAGVRKFVAIGYSMSGRFVQYLSLLAPERLTGMVIVAGAPASAMALPEEVIGDWAARAGDRERLRQIPAMFAVKPDPLLLDAYADDAIKASWHALESTLRMLLTSFEERITAAAMAVPTLVLAGKADTLLGPDTQRAIAARYTNSKVIEFDCGHEFLIEMPAETAACVAQFVAGLS